MTASLEFRQSTIFQECWCNEIVSSLHLYMKPPCFLTKVIFAQLCQEGQTSLVSSNHDSTRIQHASICMILFLCQNILSIVAVTHQMAAEWSTMHDAGSFQQARSNKMNLKFFLWSQSCSALNDRLDMSHGAHSTNYKICCFYLSLEWCAQRQDRL